MRLRTILAVVTALAASSAALTVNIKIDHDEQLSFPEQAAIFSPNGKDDVQCKKEKVKMDCGGVVIDTKLCLSSCLCDGDDDDDVVFDCPGVETGDYCSEMDVINYCEGQSKCTCGD